jgi:hypothetical protein
MGNKYIFYVAAMILSKEKKFTPIINVFLPCLLCVLCNLYIFICHTYSFAISFSFTKRKNWLGKWKLICYREIRGLGLGHLASFCHTSVLLYVWLYVYKKKFKPLIFMHRNICHSILSGVGAIGQCLSYQKEREKLMK